MSQPQRLPIPLPFEDRWIIVRLPVHPSAPEHYWSHDAGWILNPRVAESFALSADARDYAQANSLRMEQA
jgi:hypothetical protein